MACYNPCCCISLQTGTIILAIIDSVVSGILLATAIVSLVGVLTIDHEDIGITEVIRTLTIIQCILAIIFGIIQICLAEFLRRSAKKRSYGGLRKTLIVGIATFGIGVIPAVARFLFEKDPFYLSGQIIGIVYRVYMLLIVYCFMKEIENSE